MPAIFASKQLNADVPSVRIEPDAEIMSVIRSGIVTRDKLLQRGEVGDSRRLL